MFFLALRGKGARELADLSALFEGCNRAKSQSRGGSQVFFEVTDNYE